MKTSKQLKACKELGTWRVLADRALVRPDETESVTKGGIIIPEMAKKESSFGTVILTGPKICELQPGDRVIFGKYSGTEWFSKEGVRYLIGRESEVFAKIPE